MSGFSRETPLGGRTPGHDIAPVTYAPEPPTAATPAALILMDADGTIVEFDGLAEEYLGHRRAEVVGRPVSEVLVPARLRASHDAGLRRCLQTGDGPLLEQCFELPALH